MDWICVLKNKQLLKATSLLCKEATFQVTFHLTLFGRRLKQELRYSNKLKRPFFLSEAPCCKPSSGSGTIREGVCITLCWSWRAWVSSILPAFNRLTFSFSLQVNKLLLGTGKETKCNRTKSKPLQYVLESTKEDRGKNLSCKWRLLLSELETFSHSKKRGLR